jgi:hypothetical protein
MARERHGSKCAELALLRNIWASSEGQVFKNKRECP